MVYDGGAEDWSAKDIRAVLAPVRAVAEVLAGDGHEVATVPIADDLGWLDAVRRSDVVFNLCEGIGGVSHLEYKVGAAIELAGIPVTGCSSWTSTICHRKPLLNAVLAAHGLPVPEWYVTTGAPGPADFSLPAIVKPAAEDASLGIEQGSVVTTTADLAQRVAATADQFGEVMVQRYVDGREVNVGFVDDVTLPLSEIDFGGMPDGAWNIVSFDAKWTQGSPEDRGTQPVCPAPIDPALAARIVDVAEAAWRAVRGAGYGRVDLRVDADGGVWLLEVNPNPDISVDAGLANMARAAGWSYADLIGRVFDAALDRRRDAPFAGRPPRGHTERAERQPA